MVRVTTGAAEKSRRAAKAVSQTVRAPARSRAARRASRQADEDHDARHTVERSAEKATGRRLDAFPDRIDLRDWTYQPTLAALPDEIVNCADVPEILDQGQEGACTGFALAAVVNFLLHRGGAGQSAVRRISPRMLYELARRYDEWPGERYEGSSARGAMKGWSRHGVCTRRLWPDRLHGAQHFDQRRADEAMLTPGGAYYRVDFRHVRDLHAAIHEAGIVYATLMVHSGWDVPGPAAVKLKAEETRAGKRAGMALPVIQRRGRADGGHAVALVGYTAQGFIVQNSWGKGWGAGGFALLPYEDFMLHATDVWVAQLGVPVSADLWAKGAADSVSGAFRAGDVIPLNEVRPHVIDIANNGELSDRGDYWTTEADLERLFLQTIPERTRGWKSRRVMLYIHGGLNSEKDVAKRIVAFRDVCMANEIYPLHIMWETDWLSTAHNILEDQFTEADERAGGTFLDHLREARDRVLELTLALPGARLWEEMKENARLASERKSGAMNLVARHVKRAREMPARKRAGSKHWEMHVVAHSAGSILAAHAIPHLAGLGISWKTLQFLAPAIRMDAFKRLVVPAVLKKRCPRPTLYILDEEQERCDTVGPYGKSLLHLVSNAFEGEREVPLLGMQKYLDADVRVKKLLAAEIDGRSGVVVAGKAGGLGEASKSGTHGGFDNDVDTMNSVLVRILGEKPRVAFTERDLWF